MGRMECYGRDAYHAGMQLRPTPHLAHDIFYLFIYYIFDLLSDWSSLAIPQGGRLFPKKG